MENQDSPTVMIVLPDGSAIKNGLASSEQVQQLCREDPKKTRAEAMDDAWSLASNPNLADSGSFATAATQRAEERATASRQRCRFILDELGVRPAADARSISSAEYEWNKISDWWASSFDARFIRFMALVGSFHPALWAVRAQEGLIYTGSTRYGVTEYYSWRTTATGYRTFGVAASSRLSTEQYIERLTRYMAGAGRTMKVEVFSGDRAVAYIESKYPTTATEMTNGLFNRTGGPKIYLRPGLARVEVHHEMSHSFAYVQDPARYESWDSRYREVDVWMRLSNSKRWAEGADAARGTLADGRQLAAPWARYSDYERGIQTDYLQPKFEAFFDFEMIWYNFNKMFP